MKKAGIVGLIGRPNVGKSTLLNNLIGQKVTITSPKPQTTRFAIQALYEDDRGQIIFIDTPGIFGKVKGSLAKHINKIAGAVVKNDVDLILYIVDHTRQRDTEENKTLGIVRNLNIPKILVVNKIDKKRPSYIEQYAFLEDEFDTIIKISALKRKNLNKLLDALFEKLPEREAIVDTEKITQPRLNLNSKLFLSELIREKAYLLLRQEIPYTITVKIDKVIERKNGILYIKAIILTTENHYRRMIIGKKGEKIKEIGMYARKELEVATNKKVYLDLTVETDRHWVERLT